MKIHYFSGEAWEDAYVRGKLPNEDIAFHEGPLAAFPELADPEAQALCIFIESRVGEEELKRFPALKLIATRSTGFDHIDLAAARARGVAVANVPFYGENTVAEFAFALLLALSRRVIDADERVRGGAFSPAGLRGFDLAGKTLGVVGCGHIGVHVIRMASGFGMKVLGFDVNRNDELAETLNFSYATLPELLAASDIVTLHVPYNAHTHHLINRGNIALMKKGAYLINTARGAVVETDALIEGLKNGALAGAALDVLEEEGELGDETALLTSPHPNAETLKITLENHYLIEHPRVIVTPHLAFNTQEAVERILDTTVENIKSFKSGSPTNTVH
ncbi:MAG: hydroxyacid dehydrogenase [Candidatus Sungbacteria bacterium]|uniref:Hydroxyacid dehydrogenase n=1 Tax=Candidatus Sungiibacteriota bacterium TaxID=2750080 RepID=A0A932YZ85_9BACT|nr:hydroxyacid dehydrogenase [Candidatus Sungbacteria bacterium]